MDEWKMLLCVCDVSHDLMIEDRIYTIKYIYRVYELRKPTTNEVYGWSGFLNLTEEKRGEKEEEEIYTFVNPLQLFTI